MEKKPRRQERVLGYAREGAAFSLLPSARKALKKVAEKEGVTFACLCAEALIALYRIIEKEKSTTRRRRVQSKLKRKTDRLLQFPRTRAS